MLCLGIGLISFTCAVKDTNEPKSKYLRWVDDIEYDPKIDDPEFELCFGDENVYQYFNTGNGLKYKGGKIEYEEIFYNEFIPQNIKNEDGLIRIRFLVTCNGDIGRFRIIAMDNEYQEKVFDKKIMQQLIRITRSLKGWMPKKDDKKPIDYYQYLIFKIKDGNLIKILP